MKNLTQPRIVTKWLVRACISFIGVCISLYVPFTKASSTGLLSAGVPAWKCDPVVFNSVSPEIWSCLQEHLKQEGISKLAIAADQPGKESGELVGKLGARAQFIWDKKSQKLEITFTSLPVLYSCTWMANRIIGYLPGCRGGEVTREQSAGAGIWKIDTPNVKQRDTRYAGITFRAGDIVSLEAGGCVQTGGHGKTWKRYVDPLGERTNQFYHGLFRVPGMKAFVRIGEMIGKTYTIPDNVSGDMSLHLGYEDDTYENNGYWGRDGDDGEPKQCTGVGNAWVRIKVIPARKPKVTRPASANR
ncbi:MAG: hypothetical protein JST84_10840 [Acidobacteria bacterium]|nr:hypothetical protein [Acidobacteriota bacterium]